MPYQTKLLEKIDIQAYIREMDPGRVPTREEVEASLERSVLNRRISMRDLAADEEICPGDVAVIRTESGADRFNKHRVQVSVGRHMYDAVLEDALVGRRVGDSFTVRTRGAGVEVQILEAKRKRGMDRTITDEMIAELQLPYASTVDELRRWIEASANTVRFYVNGEMMPRLISEARFGPIAQEDLDAKHRVYVAELRKQFGITAEREAAMPEEARRARFQGEATLDDYVKRWWDDEKRTEEDLKSDLILMDVLGVVPGSGDDPSVDPDKHYELFERFLDHISEEVRRGRGER